MVPDISGLQDLGAEGRDHGGDAWRGSLTGGPRLPAAKITVPPRAGGFQLPVWFDLGATFALGLTGALVASKRGYDIVGVFFLALASGLGGGLARDTVLATTGAPTPLLTDPRYLEVVVGATVLGALAGRQVLRFQRVIALIDALGLGAYVALGMQKSINAGLPIPGAILVGVVNAVGGGLLRDVMTGEAPLVFRPGQFYVLAAFAGGVSFAVLTVQCGVATSAAALITVAATFVLRALSILRNWRTGAIALEAEALAPAGSGLHSRQADVAR